MCFGGGGSPSPAPIPDPTPIPTPAPTPGEAVASAEAKRKKMEALKYGAMSTIKTTGLGITGAKPDLSTPAAGGELKKTLGA